MLKYTLSYCRVYLNDDIHIQVYSFDIELSPGVERKLMIYIEEKIPSMPLTNKYRGRVSSKFIL